jgi:uncharacterized membrane protein
MAEENPTVAAVIVAVYSSEAQAKEALNQLKAMNKQETIDLLEAATVTKNDEGKIHVTDTADVGTKKGTKRGAVIGGIVGLVFPPSIIAGAVGGGAIGALYGHFRDKGISNKELEKAGAELDPGQTGLIAVVEDRIADKVAQGLEGYAKLDKYLLNSEVSAAVFVGADKTTAST